MFFLFAFYWLAKDDGDDMTEVIYSVNNNDNDQLHEVPMTASVQDIITRGLTLWGQHGITYDVITIRYTTPETDFALWDGGDVGWCMCLRVLRVVMFLVSTCPFLGARGCV